MTHTPRLRFDASENMHPTDTLRVCCGIVSLAREILAKPHADGNGADFVLSSWGAMGLATLLESLEQYLAELALCLDDCTTEEQ